MDRLVTFLKVAKRPPYVDLVDGLSQNQIIQDPCFALGKS
jgi:hypothetical protein